MLMPKRVKRRKQFRGTMAGKAMRGNTISNGEYGLVATEPCWIKSNQIEAARVAMTRYIKRGGKVWIKIFPDKPVTAKPAETRMGSGKGSLEYWVAVEMCIRDRVYCVQDTHTQAMIAATMRPGEAAVVFSYSGATKDSIHVAELAKHAGAKVICITHFAK